MTGVLSEVLRRAGYPRIVAPLLEDALHRAKAATIVDLCAGSGGPWPELAVHLSSSIRKQVRLVLLTDMFPNAESARDLLGRDHRGSLPLLDGSPQIACVRHSVNAECVPIWLKGFRTMFNSFHHFSPQAARGILDSVVRKKEGIAVFEVPQRSITTICGSALMAIGALLCVPLMRPFRWARLFWTYVIPVLPIVLWVDGMISCMRAYKPQELIKLAINTPSDYKWRAGIIRSGYFGPAITFLIGLPNSRTAFARGNPSR